MSEANFLRLLHCPLFKKVMSKARDSKTWIAQDAMETVLFVALEGYEGALKLLVKYFKRSLTKAIGLAMRPKKDYYTY